MSVVRVGRIELAYDEWGSGTPLLLVHAFAHDRRTWAEVMVGLSQRCRVIGYDQRGHGDSTHTGTPGDYTIDVLVEDVAGFVSACDLAPVHLLGHSLGGLVALRFAAGHPDQVRSLVLVNTSGAPTGALPRSVRDHLVERGRDHGMAAVARFLDRLGDLTPGERSGAARDRFRSGVAGMDVAAFAALGAALDDFPPVYDTVTELSVPVTLICGEHDESALAGAAALVAALPAAELVVLPAAGHVPHEDNGAAWLAAVHAHLVRTTAEGLRGVQA